MTPADNNDLSDDAPTDGAHQINPTLLELLVCPLTKTSLIYNSETNELISRQARLAYPIVDGIPLMTADAARELTEDDQKLIKP